jgi:hypothetical protein
VATRFRLTNAATDPPVSPALQSYTHNAPADVRRKLLLADTSTLTTVAYTPDAADDITTGDALHCQFVSDPMVSGNVFTSGDTLKMAIECLEDNAGNNLFLQVFVSVVDSAGTTVQATLRSKVADGLEMATTLTNRFHSTTLSASYTTVTDDRLVVELSAQGTPVATGGTQGHNAQLRWGGSGAGGDLGENDTDTGTTLNPWIEFATTITFPSFPPGLLVAARTRV